MHTIFAHSATGRPFDEWETLGEHARRVGARAGDFAEVFGFAALARAAGLLHDIGKCSPEFQAYIRGERAQGGDHSTAGAQAARALYGPHLGQVLAFLIAGHHAGLADGTDLAERLGQGEHLARIGSTWTLQVGDAPQPRDLAPARMPDPGGPCKGFGQAFLIRMLFSCLVDADFLETEAFYDRVNGRPAGRGGHLGLDVLRDRLAAHMAAKREGAAPTALNRLRCEVLDHVVAKAAEPPGLFTLTVPTGGGKTLASLSFALQHAVRHGLRRVVYVIPFTSIIEQSAAVFRDALGTQADILEHHTGFDWDAFATRRAEHADDEGPDGVEKLRRAAENWDAPLVVTTAVQFFESLFANRTSRCRKLHNLAKSVIVLDEAQTLPLPLLRPCMAALDQLARNYGSSIVLCTATQPALRAMDGFENGFEIDAARELAPEPERLYGALKRVAVEHRTEPTADATIADRFSEAPQMLCIVNSRDHARQLFDAIRDLPGAFHLTSLMCPLHRRAVLDEVRRRLKEGAPARVVSTSLIEAGVDISFPEVWRAAAGLDSIAQAAGRCNREGGPVTGRVVVFTPAEAPLPRIFQAFWQAARPVLRDCEDPLSLDAVRAYFGALYWHKGAAALDAPQLDGRVWPILTHIADRTATLAFPFETVARAFRFIDDAMEPVVVPWRAGDGDDRAETLLRRIAAMERPRGADLRRLQLYTVAIPKKARDAWLAWGVLRPVHPALPQGPLRFDGLEHYDAAVGVDLSGLGLRTAESNVF